MVWVLWTHGVYIYLLILITLKVYELNQLIRITTCFEVDSENLTKGDIFYPEVIVLSAQLCISICALLITHKTRQRQDKCTL